MYLIDIKDNIGAHNTFADILQLLYTVFIL